MKILFQGIQAQFPHLKMELKLGSPGVDLAMDIPSQEGLKFSIALNLQDDVLNLMTGEDYWDCWQPCTNPHAVESFRRAVCGLLSGEYRVLEYYRGPLVVGGTLQCLSGHGWKSLGRWGIFIPWRVVTKELRNV